MSSIMSISPHGFKIHSKKDAEMFCQKYFCSNQEVTFEDTNDKKWYYTLIKLKDGIYMGHTTKAINGDILKAIPVFLDKDDIVNRVYKARKSINAHFFSDRY